jgi:hypothetical protein
MSVEWGKIAKGWRDFKAETLVENGPRYKHWKEWGHLYFDNPIAWHEHNYRLIGYLSGVLLFPFWIVVWLAMYILAKEE